MKIAIIGAGFYGCHLAKKISNFKCKIDIYEKNNDILSGAIINNQHRLHLGYHYPRSEITIQQAIRSYYKFLNEYGNCCDEISENLYVINKNSHINFDKYKNLYKNYNLTFEEINKNELSNYFSNISNIDGIIKTQEKKINLTSLTKNIKENLKTKNNIQFFLNSNVASIEKDSSIIVNGVYKKYDFILNCTYSNPSLGLSKSNILTKSELCFLLLLKDNFNKFTNKAFTFVDGDFVSLYPADENGTFTLSSVIYTPFFKNNNFLPLEEKNFFLSKNELIKIKKSIFEHAKEFLNISQKDFEFIRLYKSLKTKILNDVNDFRASYYIKENNNISLMCGKISAALDLEQEIIKEIFYE